MKEKFELHRKKERWLMANVREYFFTKEQIADASGVTVKEIEDFESGESDNYYLIFVYNAVLSL